MLFATKDKTKPEFQFKIAPIFGLGYIKEKTVISHTHFETIVDLTIVILFLVIKINYLIKN